MRAQGNGNQKWEERDAAKWETKLRKGWMTKREIILSREWAGKEKGLKKGKLKIRKQKLMRGHMSRKFTLMRANAQTVELGENVALE